MPLSLPCPSKHQRPGFALLITVPFLQFLHPPALLHSRGCILAIKALATILQVPILEMLLSLTSATGCAPLPTHRCPHFPAQLLRTLRFSACVPITCRLSLPGYKKRFNPALKPGFIFAPEQSSSVQGRWWEVSGLCTTYLPALLRDAFSRGKIRRGRAVGRSNIFIRAAGVIGKSSQLSFPFLGLQSHVFFLQLQRPVQQNLFLLSSCSGKSP